MKGFFALLMVFVAAIAAANDIVICPESWTLIAFKGDKVDWRQPTTTDMANLVCHSDNIRTRAGKRISIPEKLRIVADRVEKLTGRRPELKVETFSYPRFQEMETIYRGKLGYQNGWTRKEDPGIVEKQAIRTEMYLRLSPDKQWIHILMRRFYREWAAEWCANDQRTPSIGVRDDQTMPIPRHLFERTKIKEVIKEVVREVEVEKIREVFVDRPAQVFPVIVVPWNGSYHSQGSIYKEKDLALLWLSYLKKFKCTTKCDSKFCDPDDKPDLPPPPPPPPGDDGSPPNNDENYPPPSRLTRGGRLIFSAFGGFIRIPFPRSLWL